MIHRCCQYRNLYLKKIIKIIFNPAHLFIINFYLWQVSVFAARVIHPDCCTRSSWTVMVFWPRAEWRPPRTTSPRASRSSTRSRWTLSSTESVFPRSCSRLVSRLLNNLFFYYGPLGTDAQHALNSCIFVALLKGTL